MAGPIIEFIAREPGMADRLLAIHVDDRAGRCRSCCGGGQAGHHTWPCTIHDFATRARDVERHRDPTRRCTT